MNAFERCHRSAIPVLLLLFALVIAVPAFCQKASKDGVDSEKEYELRACGPKKAKYNVSPDKQHHPTGTQTADTALIYVIRPKSFQGLQAKVAVDGEWMGANLSQGYFFFTLQPGEHYFCSVSGNRIILPLVVEAGKTYYLKQSLSGFAVRLRHDLVLMNDEDGKVELASAYLSTWKVK